MKEYITSCPKENCLGTIKIKMWDSDSRRNSGDFFEIICGNCKKEFYAKIFETLVLYPFKLKEKK